MPRFMVTFRWFRLDQVTLWDRSGITQQHAKPLTESRPTYASSGFYEPDRNFE